MKFLNKLHLLYTDKDGKFCNVEKHFDTIQKAENWLESIGAKYWEIGFLNTEIDRVKVGKSTNE